MNTEISIFPIYSSVVSVTPPSISFRDTGRARVVVSGRRDDEGQKLATELRQLGTQAEFGRTDVRYER
jgi:hypothetical protein